MMSHQFFTHNAQETMALGQRLAKYLGPGDIVCLYGDLGTGKTTLVQGMTKALKIKGKQVNSPTFVLLNIYDGKIPVYHFDLYRLENLDQISGLGYEEFFYGSGIALIEWAEKLKALCPQEYVRIRLAHVENDKRKIEISGVGLKYQKWFSPSGTKPSFK